MSVRRAYHRSRILEGYASDFVRLRGRARLFSGRENCTVERRILEGEEVSDFGWWRAREMRKYAEETRFDGGYRDGSERGGEARFV